MLLLEWYPSSNYVHRTVYWSLYRTTRGKRRFTGLAAGDVASKLATMVSGKRTSRYFAREDHAHRGDSSVHSHPEPVVRFAPVTLTDGATITTDATRGDYFRVTLGGNRTLAVPADRTDGQRIFIEALASGAQRT